MFLNTVGENIIATIKMRNIFCYPLKMVIFPILRKQYWTFLYCSQFSYRSSNFAIAKVGALNLLNFCMSFVDWFLASFLYCFPYSYRSFTLLGVRNFRERAIKKSIELIPKRMQKGLRVMTLQGAIEKCPILLLKHWKNE